MSESGWATHWANLTLFVFWINTKFFVDIYLRDEVRFEMLFDMGSSKISCTLYIWSYLLALDYQTNATFRNNCLKILLKILLLMLSLCLLLSLWWKNPLLADLHWIKMQDSAKKGRIPSKYDVLILYLKYHFHWCSFLRFVSVSYYIT